MRQYPYNRTETPEEHRRRKRNEYLRWKYGITLGDLEEMFYAQDGQCPICGQEILLETTNRGNDHVVDHDHATGEVRGLLCRTCNGALGGFRDSVERLQRAIEYLTNR